MKYLLAPALAGIAVLQSLCVTPLVAAVDGPPAPAVSASATDAGVRPPSWFRGSSCEFRAGMWRINQQVSGLITKFQTQRAYDDIYKSLLQHDIPYLETVAKAYGVPVTGPFSMDNPQMKPLRSDVYTVATQTLMNAMYALIDAAGDESNPDPQLRRQGLGNFRLAVADNTRECSLLKELACVPPTSIRVWVRPMPLHATSHPTVYVRSVVGAYCTPEISYSAGSDQASFKSQEQRVGKSRVVKWTWHRMPRGATGTVQVGCTLRGGVGRVTLHFHVT